MQQPSFGNVWQQATANIAELLHLDLPEGERLQRILGLGYFSQFTSYPSAQFNEAVVSWLEQYLARRHGVCLRDLPPDLAELDIVPSATLVCRDGRKLSPDLLRYVAYAMLLRQASLHESMDPTEVLEIGGGYGGLARTLKCFHPQSRFWLTDIPESLRCAEIYLRGAFPGARIMWLDAELGGDVPEADFLLVPVAEASRVLSGRSFDLAINVWSFGEMPNQFVDTWLKLVQRDCRIKRLFAINSFMAPVTPPSVSRAQVGDWLLGLDDRWVIEHFEIDPDVHRCPLIRNFPKGIGVVARRGGDEHELSQLRDSAARDAEAVLLEDWAGIAVTELSASDPGRPERMLALSGAEFDGRTISSQRLVALTDYIGYFNIESGQAGPFFRLWNDWRLNRSARAGALLVAYLAMVGKADLERRCSKEELFLLKRLAVMPLHQEYAAFGVAVEKGKIAHEGECLTDQEACDRALVHRAAGELVLAEALFIKVAIDYPAHGYCWFQLAQLQEMRAATHLAAVFAAHSVYLGCDYYSEAAERMRSKFFASLQSRDPLMLPCTVSDCCLRYFNSNAMDAIADLVRSLRASGFEDYALALEQAAVFYS